MKIEVDIPDGKIGEYAVETFEVTKSQADFFNLRCLFSSGGMNRGREIVPGTYKRLIRGRQTIMSNTPAEIRDHFEFIRRARGNVLIAGLGLGVALKAILEKDDVESVTVVEISPEVIQLVGKHFESDTRVNIVQGDIMEYKIPRGVYFDSVWFDIWDYISAGNVPQMKKLHRRFARRCSYQSSWNKQLCYSMQ